jgi:predicted small lipoprotein YifL
MLSHSRPITVLAVLIAGLAACGCSGPSTTGPGAVPTETTTTVVLSQTLDEVEVGGQRVVDFSLPHRGTLVLTVRWNDPANSVVAVLTSTACRSFRNPDGDCRVRRSVERQGKEGREQFIDSPDAAGAYQLLLENEGPGMESIRVSAELTSEVAAPAPPTPHPTGPPNRVPNPQHSGYPR